MSSFKRGFFVLSLLCLTACGFEPLYGTGSAAGQNVIASLPEIEIGNIPDRDGQELRNLLMDRLYTHGRPDAAPYSLAFTRLTTDIVNLGIQKDATATRAEMRVATRMELKTSAGALLLARDLSAHGAYNLLDDQLATLSSKENITHGLLREMRDDAVMQLSLYFRRAAE